MFIINIKKSTFFSISSNTNKKYINDNEMIKFIQVKLEKFQGGFRKKITTIINSNGTQTSFEFKEVPSGERLRAFIHK